jgi:hypothetical protein
MFRIDPWIFLFLSFVLMSTCTTKSIEQFIEGQTFLLAYDSALRPPPPPFSPSVNSTGDTQEIEMRGHLPNAYGMGGRGWGGAKSYDHKKRTLYKSFNPLCSAIITIYATMIYTAPYIMFWMRAYPLRGQVGGSWALEFESFLGPVKWHQTNRRVPFGAQKTRGRFQGPY